jgi:hypothetical protein
MRRAPPAVEEPSGAQHERAGADRHDPSATVHGGGQGGEDLCGICKVPSRGRNGDQVGFGQPLDAVLDRDREPHRGPDQASGQGTDGEVEPGNPLVRAVDSEGLAQHAELERRHAVERDYGNVGQHD